MKRIAPGLVLLLASLSMLAGCGGKPAAGKTPQETLKNWVEAIETGDGDRLARCYQDKGMTRALMRGMAPQCKARVEYLRKVEAAYGDAVSESAPDSLEGEWIRCKNAPKAKIVITGETAIAKFPDAHWPMGFQKENGRWLIQSTSKGIETREELEDVLLRFECVTLGIESVMADIGKPGVSRKDLVLRMLVVVRRELHRKIPLPKPAKQKVFRVTRDIEKGQRLKKSDLEEGEIVRDRVGAWRGFVPYKRYDSLVSNGGKIVHRPVKKGEFLSERCLCPPDSLGFSKGIQWGVEHFVRKHGVLPPSMAAMGYEYEPQWWTITIGGTAEKPVVTAVEDGPLAREWKALDAKDRAAWRKAEAEVLPAVRAYIETHGDLPFQWELDIPYKAGEWGFMIGGTRENPTVRVERGPRPHVGSRRNWASLPFEDYARPSEEVRWLLKEPHGPCPYVLNGDQIAMDKADVYFADRATKPGNLYLATLAYREALAYRNAETPPLPAIQQARYDSALEALADVVARELRLAHRCMRNRDWAGAHAAAKRILTLHLPKETVDKEDTRYMIRFVDEIAAMKEFCERRLSETTTNQTGALPRTPNKNGE